MAQTPTRTGTTKKAPGSQAPRKKHPRTHRNLLTSKVTSRWQTTLPSGVRKALELQAGDEVVYVIQGDEVLIRKAAESGDDPALAGFLDLIESGISGNKESIVFATRSFADYLDELTAGIEVDYDAPIEGGFRL